MDPDRTIVITAIRNMDEMIANDDWRYNWLSSYEPDTKLACLGGALHKVPNVWDNDSERLSNLTLRIHHMLVASTKPANHIDWIGVRRELVKRYNLEGVL